MKESILKEDFNTKMQVRNPRSIVRAESYSQQVNSLDIGISQADNVKEQESVTRTTVVETAGLIQNNRHGSRVTGLCGFPEAVATFFTQAK